MSKRSTKSASSFDFETLGDYRAALGITGTQDAGEKANKQYVNFGIKSDRAAFKKYVGDVKEEFAGVIKLQQAVSKAGGPLEATLDGEVYVLDQAFVSAARLDVEKRLDRIVDITYSSRPNVDLDGNKILRDGDKITNGSRYYNADFVTFINESIKENYPGIKSKVTLGSATTSNLNSLITALCKPAQVDGKSFTASKALVTLLHKPTVVQFENIIPESSQTNVNLQTVVDSGNDTGIAINVKASKGTTKRFLYNDESRGDADSGMDVLVERSRAFHTNLSKHTAKGVVAGMEYPVALGAVVTSLYSYNSSEYKAIAAEDSQFPQQLESVRDEDNNRVIEELTNAIKASSVYTNAVNARKAAKAASKEEEKKISKQAKEIAKEEKAAAKDAAKEEKAAAKEAAKAAKAKSDRGRSPGKKAKAAPKKPARGASKSRSRSRGASKPRSRSRGASKSRSPSRSPSRSRSRSRSPSKSPTRSASRGSSRGSSRGRSSAECPPPAMSPVSRRTRK